MLRVCRSPAVKSAVRLVRIHQTKRIACHFGSTAYTAKRVTRGLFDEIFGDDLEKPDSAALNDLVEDLAPPGDPNTAHKAKGKKKALEPKEETSGSVVLDAVRDYTKRHPTCVLLMQVGDFFEVYPRHKKEREREREQAGRRHNKRTSG